MQEDGQADDMDMKSLTSNVAGLSKDEPVPRYVEEQQEDGESQKTK